MLGAEAFRSDVLASAGLDDRSSSNGYLKRAEELMADAVGDYLHAGMVLPDPADPTLATVRVTAG